MGDEWVRGRTEDRKVRSIKAGGGSASVISEGWQRCRAGQGWGSCIQWSRQPGFVVQFDVEVRAKHVMHRSMASVGTSAVRPIDGFSRPDDWWQHGEFLGMESVGSSIRLACGVNSVSANLEELTTTKGPQMQQESLVTWLSAALL